MTNSEACVVESADGMKRRELSSVIEDFLIAQDSELPLDCPLSVTSGQSLSRCEPVYKHNLCWACSVSEAEYRNASAYTGPSRDPYIPQEARASLNFEGLARLTPYPGLTRDLLDGNVTRTPIKAYGRSLALPLTGLAFALLWLLCTLTAYLPKCIFRSIRPKPPRKTSSQLLRTRNVVKAAAFILTPIIAIAVGITVKAAIMPGHNLPLCLISRALYETNYGGLEKDHSDKLLMVQNGIDIPDFYSGLVRVEHVMTYLFSMVSGIRLFVDNTAVSRSLLSSLESIWAPVLFTSRNLRSTPFISWKSREGDDPPTLLRHDLALALAMRNDSIFSWNKTYADHQRVIEQLGEIALPPNLTDAIAQVESAADDFRSQAADAISPLYTGLDQVAVTANKLQRRLYGNKSWIPKFLYAFPMILSLASLVTIGCVVFFTILSRNVNSPRPKLRAFFKGGAIFTAAIVGGITLGSGCVLIIVSALTADLCQIVEKDLLKNDLYENYKIFNHTLPLSILQECIYGNGTGNLYSAMGLHDYLHSLSLQVKKYEAELAIHVKPGEQLFSFIDDPEIHDSFLTLITETNAASTVLPGGISDAPNLFMTDIEFVWSTDAVDSKVALEDIRDPLLKPLLESMWMAAETNMTNVDFPSLGNAFPWVSEPPQLLPLSSVSSALQRIFAGCPNLDGRKICSGFDETCNDADDIIIEARSVFWMDPQWFADEKTLVQNLDNVIGAARTQRVRRLMDCMRSMPTAKMISAALAIYQTVIKDFVFGYSNMERHIDAYVLPGQASIELCPIGKSCPIAYGFFTDDEENRLALITRSEMAREVKAWSLMAVKALNPQLAYHLASAFLRLNPLQQVWQSVNSVPETFDCKILNRMIDRSEKALCKRVAPGIVTIAYGWIVCGLGSIVLSCLLVCLMKPPPPDDDPELRQPVLDSQTESPTHTSHPASP